MPYFIFTDKKPPIYGGLAGVISSVFLIGPWVILWVLNAILSWQMRRLFNFSQKLIPLHQLEELK